MEMNYLEGHGIRNSHYHNATRGSVLTCRITVFTGMRETENG